MEKSFSSKKPAEFSQKEWLDYAKEYNIEYKDDIWQMYLWGKDSEGNIIPDISQSNVFRCKKLYDVNPKDINNAIRWLWINIVAGKWTRKLMNEVFAQVSQKDAEYIFICLLGSFTVDNEDIMSNKERIEIKRYKGIKKFIKSVIKDDMLMSVWREYMNEDPEDLGLYINLLSKICGREYVFNNLNLDFIRNDFSISFCEDFNIDLFFVLAEYYYKKSRWVDALYFYERIKLLNEKEEVADNQPIIRGGLSEFNIKFDFIEDIFREEVLLKDIKDRIKNCINSIIKEGDANGIMFLLEELISRCDIYLDSLFELSRLSSSISLVKSLINHDMVSFREEVESLLGKVEVFKKSMFPFHDVFINTLMYYYLGNDEKELKEILSIANSRMDTSVTLKSYFIIIDLEQKMREFIRFLLEEKYGRRNAWYKGVSLAIRQKASARKEEDPKSRKWDCLDFSDYADIISSKDNWHNIFKKYFSAVEPSASNAKKQLALFRKLPTLRNIIAHNRRNLTKEEKQILMQVKELFDEIYKRWKGGKNNA